mgnify:FL=1
MRIIHAVTPYTLLIYTARSSSVTTSAVVVSPTATWARGRTSSASAAGAPSISAASAPVRFTESSPASDIPIVARTDAIPRTTAFAPTLPSMRRPTTLRPRPRRRRRRPRPRRPASKENRASRASIAALASPIARAFESAEMFVAKSRANGVDIAARSSQADELFAVPRIMSTSRHR